MRPGTTHGFVGAILVAAIAGTASARHPRPTASSQNQACAVTVDSAISVSVTPVTVLAHYSGSIGDSVSASFEAGSHITVGQAAAAGAQSVSLILDTSHAATGNWTLTLSGTKGQCSGQVAVAGT
jgi:hypothetical protein